jgi:S-adenosylmethionine:tRNA ribosyltransferase-isomerase
MHPKDIKIADYSYHLPNERIAQYPVEPRDSARLLVYNNGAISEATYSQLPNYLPKGATLVYNQTKVIHARLLLQKPSGGVIEVFCLEPDSRYADVPTAMLQKGRVLWRCLVGGAKKWKAATTLQATFPDYGFTLSAAVVAQLQGTYSIELSWDNTDLTFAEVLHYAGKIPLPPYMARAAEAKDEQTYQTVYAKEEGSVAAPTAGLHFTEPLLGALATAGIDSQFVTLHVGAGTFMPVKTETIGEHDMHTEWIEVTAATIAQLLRRQVGPLVAVGTTSMRTLETLYHIGNKLVQGQSVDWQGATVSQWDAYETTNFCSTTEALQALLLHLEQQNATRLVTRTQILIAPGYTFRMVDGLITNFHQPESTLLLLIAALIGGQWRQVYDYALQNNFRFLSYGDGSLLWSKGYLG